MARLGITWKIKGQKNPNDGCLRNSAALHLYMKNGVII